MAHVRIYSHADCEPPGYLETLLSRLGLGYEVVCLHRGICETRAAQDVGALVFLGGPGNPDQPEPWMEQEMELIRQAHAQSLPILGICLGAQLMSKALGGRVWQADSVEVGWHRVSQLPAAREFDCFHSLPVHLEVFQWHAHVFDAPPGSTPVFTSDCTECQGFVLNNSLAIQFHLEMNAAHIESLIDLYGSDLMGDSACVQKRGELLDGIEQRCEQAFAIADIMLGKWFSRHCGCG